jgi:hypothetical protein
LPGRPKDNHYKSSDQRVSVSTETFNMAFLGYLEEEEVIGGGGREVGGVAQVLQQLWLFVPLQNAYSYP